MQQQVILGDGVIVGLTAQEGRERKSPLYLLKILLWACIASLKINLKSNAISQKMEINHPRQTLSVYNQVNFHTFFDEI